MRATKKNIYELAPLILKTAIELGLALPGDEIAISAGSSSYARSWGFELRRDGVHLHFPGIDLHGCFTATEAWLNLASAHRAFMAVKDVRK